jgi:hypothetical protein
VNAERDDAAGGRLAKKWADRRPRRPSIIDGLVGFLIPRARRYYEHQCICTTVSSTSILHNSPNLVPVL